MHAKRLHARVCHSSGHWNTAAVRRTTLRTRTCFPPGWHDALQENQEDQGDTMQWRGQGPSLHGTNSSSICAAQPSAPPFCARLATWRCLPVTPRAPHVTLQAPHAPHSESEQSTGASAAAGHGVVDARHGAVSDMTLGHGWPPPLGLTCTLRTRVVSPRPPQLTEHAPKIPQPDTVQSVFTSPATACTSTSISGCSGDISLNRVASQP
jgi:hypothetical protein